MFGEGEWKTRIHGKNKRRQWIKMHLGVNVENNQIITTEITKSNTHDSEVIHNLLSQVNNEVDNVYADGTYDTSLCYQDIKNIGAKTIIPPRKNAIY